MELIGNDGVGNYRAINFQHGKICYFLLMIENSE